MHIDCSCRDDRPVQAHRHWPWGQIGGPIDCPTGISALGNAALVRAAGAVIRKLGFRSVVCRNLWTGKTGAQSGVSPAEDCTAADDG